MIQIKFFTCLILAVSVSACGDVQKSNKAVDTAKVSTQIAEQTPSPIEIINKSPDQTIKSWWKVRDLHLSELYKYCLAPSEIKWEADKYYPKITDGAVLNELQRKEIKCEKTTYEREILEVKVESETRAIVLAKIKNTTPIPTGIVLTERQAKELEEGGKVKYTLENLAGGWKINQIAYLSAYGDNRWVALYEETPKPRLDTSTFGGY